MGLDEGAATALAERGATAVRARREMLHTGGGRSLGEALLPGAYPPPVRPTVTFTAFLKGTSLRRLQQTTYVMLVRAQATRAGAASPTVQLLSITGVSGGVNVRTRVTLRFGEAAAAQQLVYRLTVNPGADAPWLDRTWPGSSVSNVVG